MICWIHSQMRNRHSNEKNECEQDPLARKTSRQNVKMQVLLSTAFILVVFPTSILGLVATDPALNLQRYLDQQGATRSCETGETKFGRGLVATIDLEPDEVALRIPLSCALQEPDLGEEDYWAGRLALQVMERRRQSCPYTDALPPPPGTPARGDWPVHILKAFEDPLFEKEIDAAQNWRYEQWENKNGLYEDRSEFLDALDLVCSRTTRIGSDLLLVPFLDMANHASQEEGGGYYVRDGADVCLIVGERGVRKGGEVTLNYGPRRNEDWLIHYGFLPDRNTADAMILPSTQQKVSWDDVGTASDSLRQECSDYLDTKTSLAEDLAALQDSKLDHRMALALEYRVSRKMLLSAVAGDKAATPATSAFFSFGAVVESK